MPPGLPVRQRGLLRRLPGHLLSGPRVYECDEGDAMGKEARTGLLLGATCCLLAVMVDWIVTELK